MKNQREPHLCYAVPDDGVELPVIDITHPAFAVEIGSDEMPEFVEKSLGAMEHSQRMPSFIAALASAASARGCDRGTS